ncbi:hypothetical protein VTK26DRAFT_3430 [Humicola hyalothermophila]
MPALSSSTPRRHYTLDKSMAKTSTANVLLQGIGELLQENFSQNKEKILIHEGSHGGYAASVCVPWRLAIWVAARATLGGTTTGEPRTALNPQTTAGKMGDMQKDHDASLARYSQHMP